MTRLIVASTNKSKLKEIKQIYNDLPLEIVSLQEVGFDEEILETGSTYYENAKIKSEYISKRFPTDLVLADDSGMSINILDGEPGIYSARYLGEDVSFEGKMYYILGRLYGLDESSRGANFTTALVLSVDGKAVADTTGTIYGRISTEPRGENGFGYDPIFIPRGLEETFAELTPGIKNAISHRYVALNKMKAFLEKYLSDSKQSPEVLGFNSPNLESELIGATNLILDIPKIKECCEKGYSGFHSFPEYHLAVYLYPTSNMLSLLFLTDDKDHPFKVYTKDEDAEAFKEIHTDAYNVYCSIQTDAEMRSTSAVPDNLVSALDTITGGYYSGNCLR